MKVADAVQVGLLRLFRRLPTKARRWTVRILAPSYTVGAICVITRPDGHILLVKQIYRERWGVPGGLVKRGEDAADCARREVREEVGIDIELEGAPVVVVDAGPQRVDLVFRARPATLQEVAQVKPSSPEIREVRWFPPDGLPELQMETADAMVSLARQAVIRGATARPITE